MTPRILAGCGLAALSLTACASQKNLVVVLPEPNGHVGAVVVKSGSDTTVLNTGYAAAAPTTRATRPLPAGSVTPEKVKRLFGDALGALPAAPISLNLYFDTGTELTTESKTALTGFLESLKGRKAIEIVITGHTDTVDTVDYNDALSLRRAEAIKAALLPTLTQYGVVADDISAVGRGERELLVQTPDNTAEPRNRRVEITVR